MEHRMEGNKNIYLVDMCHRVLSVLNGPDTLEFIVLQVFIVLQKSVIELC